MVDADSDSFGKDSKRYRHAYEACRKEFPEADDEILASCAESSMFSDLLRRLRKL